MALSHQPNDSADNDSKDASDTATQSVDYTSLPYDNPKRVQYLPTTAAYDLWAPHYDHDGNFLQALDSVEMKSLLPDLISRLEHSSRKKPWKVIDLGCGTGRNTVGTLEVDGVGELVAVDASGEMLEVAKKRVGDVVAKTGWKGEVTFGVLDLLANGNLLDMVVGADAVVSTLVLEHIPVEVYWEKVAEMLKPGGWCLMTNMHSEMGGISQAGFVDPVSGEKIRPVSFAHTVKQVVQAAEKNGLRCVGGMQERSVTEQMVEGLGPRSRKWIGVKVWYGGLFQKMGSPNEIV